MRILFVLSILLSTSVITAQRNAAEEAICQKFLTSKSSSPLIPTATAAAAISSSNTGGGGGGVLKRNLRYDEECEFSCELVLQDRHLPIQIRATIHEGLGHLALRHIELGM